MRARKRISEESVLGHGGAQGAVISAEQGHEEQLQLLPSPLPPCR